MSNGNTRPAGPGAFAAGVFLIFFGLIWWGAEKEPSGWWGGLIGLWTVSVALGVLLCLVAFIIHFRAVAAFLRDYWLAILIVLTGIVTVYFAGWFGDKTGLTGKYLWLAVIGTMLALDGLWALIFVLTRDKDAEKSAPRTAVAGNVAFLFKVAIILLAAVNWIGANWLSTRLGTIDTTETQVYTLSDKTKRILDELANMPGRLTATYIDFGSTMRAMPGEEPLGRRGMDFLTQYSDYTPHFRVKEYNGIIESAELKQHFRKLGIVKPDLGNEDTVVFTYLPPGEDVPNRKDVTVSRFNFIETTQLQTQKFKGEQVYTSAVQDVIYPRKKVYFVKGHGEYETSGGGEVNLSAARELTRKLALETDSLSIAEKGRVPKDTDLLIIGGPQTPLLAEEVEMLTGYLEQGGSLILMLGPQQDLLAPGSQHTPFGLDDYLAKLGIKPRTDMVCVDYDPSISSTGEVSVQRGLTILTSDYSSDRIVRDLARQGLQVRFPRACPITILEQEDNSDVKVEALVHVRRNVPGRPELKSYAAKLYPGRDIVTEDVRNDLLDQRLPIAVTAEKTLAGVAEDRVSRIVVFGDTSFATTLGLEPRSRFYAPGNSTLFSNAVSWAVKRESLIAIDAKTLERETVALEDGEIRLAKVVALWAIPGFVLLLGKAVWWRRRR